jgi:hypothetical protein
MRTYLVEVSPPFFDQNFCLGARTKPFEAQTLVAELAVEALRDAILHYPLCQNRQNPLLDL